MEWLIRCGALRSVEGSPEKGWSRLLNTYSEP